MSMSDPIADMLNRIRNAHKAGHPEATVPASKEKEAIATAMRDAGFLASSSVSGEGKDRTLVLGLKYHQNKPVITGIKRVSKPSCRIYVKAKEIPRIRGGMGIAILSTPEGILPGKEARRRNLGGEVICYVW